MRRALRHTAALVLAGLLATACAQVSADERALLDEAAETSEPSSDTTDPTSETDTDDGDKDEDEDEEEDEPWLSDEALPSKGTADERPGPRPEIKQFRCPFDRTNTTTSRCGKIEVPGRGDDPDYTVEISFVRFSATGEEEDRHPDPVVYLHGGPGGAILETADFWYDSIVAPHIETRDVILYDQRGAGRSTPLPSCDETTVPADRFYTEEASHDTLRDDFLTALAACATRIRAEGEVDLTAFNSAANAQDLVDLMWALGIEEYNLHGSSYGTRLAQTIMRDAPEGVRSVVLSGAYPIDANLMGSVPVSLESSLEAVFAGCAASARCNAALPDPWATLEALVRQLDADPLAVDVASTATTSITLAFDGTDLLNGLHSVLYHRFYAATVPDLLIDSLDGDLRRIQRLARASVFDHAEVANFIVVQCADEADFVTEEVLRRPLEHEFLRAADIAPALNGLDALTICDAWKTGDTPAIENDPVSWDAPTLLLSGALDPITPPEWAAALAARLPRGRLVTMADLSHDSDEGWCALEMIADFVAEPDVLPDTSCAAFADTLAVDERAVRFAEPFALVDQSYDFDGDDEPVQFNGPDWSSDWADEALILWRALDQLDQTALILFDVDSAYDLVDHYQFVGPAPDWVAEPRPDLPPGWARELMVTEAATMTRYSHQTSGVALVLVVEPGEPEDLERLVLLPVARAIGDAS